MQRLLKKIRIWLGLEEPRWWDEEPVAVIRGTDLLAVLNHRMGCS